MKTFKIKKGQLVSAEKNWIVYNDCNDKIMSSSKENANIICNKIVETLFAKLQKIK